MGSPSVVRFAVAPCSLGVVLVAATDRGVCEVALGDDADALAAGLRGRFPGAEPRTDGPEFAAWVAAVVAAVDAPAAALDLPLDVRGTAFQRRVWDELRAVPPGTTTTYAELAKRLGRPGAARAVGAACGANPVSLVVPCHRVVGAAGLTGYRWGVERKRELLRREAAG